MSVLCTVFFYRCWSIIVPDIASFLGLQNNSAITQKTLMKHCFINILLKQKEIAQDIVQGFVCVYTVILHNV